MMCEDVRKSLALYLYGELPFEEEEALESHLDACEACREGERRNDSEHK